MQCYRPLGEPPKVWKHIEKTDKNGKLMKFTIQEIPEDRYEDAIEHMCTYFLADEPTNNCFNAKNDHLFIQDTCTILRLLLTQGISIAAFIDNPDGGKPIIAGMNVLGINAKGQKDVMADFQVSVKVPLIRADLQKKMDKMQCFRPSGEPPKVWKHIEKTDKDGKLL
ncbi:PREDICTED: uncharacterized protein LOC105457336, partial [Wasmannia auropunctata]|uniref:uncharacterized protein LOC105457336 n=1 Tax=Wasmannia auropunctata TaxID=64793 RepID=UPI0005EE7641